MTVEDDQNGGPVLRGVRARRKRARRWEREGRGALLGQLTLVGSLGWMIVAPTLAGIVLGRWLDGRLGTGIQATGALLVAGAATGCWLAWKRMHQE